MATIPAKPSSGEATKKSWADAVVDALSDHEAQLGGLLSGVKNGSFETLTGTAPSEWTISSTNATASSETTVVAHGAKSVKTTFSSADGSTTWTSEDLIPVAYGEWIAVEGNVKANAAGNPAKVTLLWYQADGSASSVTASEDIVSWSDLSTSWVHFQARGACPSDATYYKLRLTGGGTGSDNTEIVYFDGISARVYHGPLFHAAATVATYTGAGTNTVTYSSQPGNEAPTHVWISATNTDVGTCTITVEGWIGGAWTTQNVFPIQLDPSGQYRVVIGSVSAPISVELVEFGVQI